MNIIVVGLMYVKKLWEEVKEKTEFDYFFLSLEMSQRKAISGFQKNYHDTQSERKSWATRRMDGS